MPACGPQPSSASGGKPAGERDEILNTILLPHYFATAFTREQVHRYVRVKLDRERLDAALRDLVRDGLVTERDGCLYARDLHADHEQKRSWSRDLFRRHRRSLRTLSRFPWVRYMGLTGANAFESCRREDDLDLFVVTAPDRLWVTFMTMIAFCRLIGKRDLFCINYLVDEHHMHITHQSYYTAVQLMSMVPLVDRATSTRLLEANRWVFEFLPNAVGGLKADSFYSLEESAGEGRHLRLPLMAVANRRLYRLYARRLQRKYPEAFGAGIVVSEAAARLHRIDYVDLYDQITAERSQCS